MNVASSLSIEALILALLTVGLNGAAQLLLRGAALAGATPSAPMSLVKSPLFLIALAAYGLSVLTWLAVLKKLPLAIAMPFVSLAYVLVPLGARLLFGEELGVRWGVGTALVILGVIIISTR